MTRPTGRREIVEAVVTATLCTAATVLVEGIAGAVERAQEAKREQERRDEKKRKKGKK